MKGVTEGSPVQMKPAHHRHQRRDERVGGRRGINRLNHGLRPQQHVEAERRVRHRQEQIRHRRRINRVFKRIVVRRQGSRDERHIDRRTRVRMRHCTAGSVLRPRRHAHRLRWHRAGGDDPPRGGDRRGAGDRQGTRENHRGKVCKVREWSVSESMSENCRDSRWSVVLRLETTKRDRAPAPSNTSHHVRTRARERGIVSVRTDFRILKLASFNAKFGT